MRSFRNRQDAGRALADLLAMRRYPNPVVLALPRGGVPVGLEVSRRLRAPLDLVMVRKIGAPMQPELAVGAVVNGDAPEIVVNEEVARWAGLSREEISVLGRKQLGEIARRRELYLAGRSEVPIAGRTAIVVDDGVATGASMRAALRAVRRRDPARLVLAVPVAAQETLEALRAEVDGIVCPVHPYDLGSIGAFYQDFSQLRDEEVVAMLEDAGRSGVSDADAADGGSEPN